MATTRVLKKQLAGEEDLLLGEVIEDQQRAGGTYPITGLRYVRPCTSLGDLEPTKFPYAALYEGEAVTLYKHDGNDFIPVAPALISPNGTKFKLVVSDAGELATEAL